MCQSADNEFGFEADAPARCHAYTAISEARIRMGEDVPTPEALLFSARLKTPGGLTG